MTFFYYLKTAQFIFLLFNLPKNLHYIHLIIHHIYLPSSSNAIIFIMYSRCLLSENYDWMQVLVEIDSKDREYNEITPVTDTNNTISTKKRKKDSPSPIALEPCAGNKAAVLSLLVRMPTGKNQYIFFLTIFLSFIFHGWINFFNEYLIFNYQIHNELFIVICTHILSLRCMKSFTQKSH